jgi:hypothetical protein
MPYRVILHRNTLGVTQLALQALRNELAARAKNHICVIEVPTTDTSSGPDTRATTQTYGYFIVDKDAGNVVIIGDGFRGDGGGEGGAGHRAAQALLSIYGIHAEQAMEEESVNYVADEKAYKDVVDKFVDIAEANGFVVLADLRPRYPDWVYSRK